MAGFVPPEETYRLVFEDGKLAGLEVRMRGLSIKEFRRFRNATPTDEDDLMALFADRLIEWNVTRRDGTPVPPTLEGVEEQGPTMIRTIVTGWLRETTEVPTPLDRSSDDGPPSEVASIPMETLSESLAS